MQLIKLLLLPIIVFISSPSIAKNQSVYFEPKVVELEGAIRTLKFPGSPNYESIKNGDADETGPYLILNNPIDIKLVPKMQIGNDEPEKNVKIIQLVVRHDNDWKNVKEGNYVHITGTLFHALTGHHHARVLLWINKIKVFSTQKNINKKLNITKEDKQFLDHEYLQN
ncbi:MAG: hypothetical protein A3E82_08730 [Gammaproteobacteria bacterium RIFCSPHIGHO2_12_FULL_38_11]|nr:MAG: hypothetical protein A3E82_08730 [Gammaproteobacteria bacterium RIFCSPHIGHO2_12_FULL_38_11]